MRKYDVERFVNSAKCRVFGWEDAGNDSHRQVNFYVGCTRAIEYLEVFAYRNDGLAVEFERVLARQEELAGRN